MGSHQMSGTGGGWMLRHAAVVVFVVFLSFSAVAEDAAEVSEVFDAEIAADSEGTKRFSKIPGLSGFTDGATVVPNKSRDGCANVCAGEKKCRSFAYRMESKSCIWFLSSMIYDPDFVYGTKTKFSKNHHFRKTTGMTYEQGWTVVPRKTEAECRAKCITIHACKAYSSRERDKLCLLGAQGIKYSDDFDYYEKKGLVHKPFPTPPADAGCSGSLCANPTPPKKKPCDPTDNKALQALEAAEKSRAKLAKKDGQQASADEKATKEKVKAMEAKAKADIAKLKLKDSSKLSEMEKEQLKSAKEKVSKTEETMRLQFGAENLQKKIKGTAGKAAREKERVTKKAYTVEQRAAAAAERETKLGKNTARQTVAKNEVASKQTAAMELVQKGNDAKAKAALDKIKTDADRAALRDEGRKKVKQEQEKVEKEEAKTLLDEKQKRDAADAAAKEIADKQTEKDRIRRAEEAKAELLRSKERTQKEQQKVAAEEKSTKAKEKAASEKITKMQEKAKKEGRELTEQEKNLIAGQAKIEKTSKEMNVKKKKAQEEKSDKATKKATDARKA